MALALAHSFCEQPPLLSHAKDSPGVLYEHLVLVFYNTSLDPDQRNQDIFLLCFCTRKTQTTLLLVPHSTTPAAPYGFLPQKSKHQIPLSIHFISLTQPRES